MLIHFPVALWPAHFGLHALAARFPTDVSAVGGFWLLAAGTAAGWFAATCGALDLIAIAHEADAPRMRTGLIHAAINGTVLLGFTILAVLETGNYPTIHHGWGFLAGEGALLAAMFAGNYFGGALVWPANRRDAPCPPSISS